MRPRGSVIIGNSSCCSRMTGLIAERKSTASISNRAFFSAPSMMSSVTGSTVTSMRISAIRISSWCVVVIAALSVVRVDQDVEVHVDLGGVTGEHDGRRVELRHYRRAVEPHLRLELRPVVDLRRVLPAFEPDLLLVDDCAGRVRAARLADCQLRLGHAAEADGAKVDDLRCCVGHPE